jgi:hypothetical protein
VTLAVRATALVVTAAGLACARQGNPSGGPPDILPPVVIATDPAPKSMVEDLETVIRFRFSERVSERPARGVMNDAVMVSPRAGPVYVEPGRELIEVSVDGGLSTGLVYRFTLLPVITDLFGNVMREPFELVLSTGAPLVEDALVGQVLDRVTGGAVQGVEVTLTSLSPVRDTVVHVSRSDAAGLFVFRYVPPGRYNLIAFEDQNRNLAPDPREPFGRRGVLLNANDTLLADVTILEPDTSAAQLVRAEVVDSSTLRLVFSDYLDPESVGTVVVSLGGPEGEALAQVIQVLHPTVWEVQNDSARAGDDGPSAPGGRVPLPGETVTVSGQERGGLPRGVPLPRQEVIVTLASPLSVAVPYQLVVTGVVNINLIPLGRGEAAVMRSPPPDSIGSQPDTTQVGSPARPR